MVKEQLHKWTAREFVEEMLEAFHEGRCTEKLACQMLKISRAHLYRLRREWLRCKARNKEFKLYNRDGGSFYEFPEEVKQFLREELRYIREEAKLYRGYFDFADLAQEAEKKFGKPFHRNSIRRFALREGYYTATPEEKRKVYVRFETSGPGVLYQHDSSYHLWLPDLGQKVYLILTKDDYSRMIVGWKLAEEETAWEHLCVARGTIQRYNAIPLNYYVDEHSLFKFVRHEGIHNITRISDDEAKIQFRRALKSVGTGIIYAEKPEAKGKIEKMFDYFQRRIPKRCERYKVIDIEEANKILEEEIWFYNEKRIQLETQEIPKERWNKAIKDGKSKLRPIPTGKDLETIFSLQYQRMVKKDGTISFQGRSYKVGQFPLQEVTVCVIPYQKIIVLKDEQRIGDFPLY